MQAGAIQLTDNVGGNGSDLVRDVARLAGAARVGDERSWPVNRGGESTAGGVCRRGGRRCDAAVTEPVSSGGSPIGAYVIEPYLGTKAHKR